MFDFVQKLFGFKKNSDNDDSAVPNHTVVKDDVSKTSYSQEGEINQIEKGKCSDLCDFSCSCC